MVCKKCGKEINIESEKCPFCGEEVKIRHTNPLKFTQTCCKKECVIKLHNERRDKITGLFKKKK